MKGPFWRHGKSQFQTKQEFRELDFQMYKWSEILINGFQQKFSFLIEMDGILWILKSIWCTPERKRPRSLRKIWEIRTFAHLKKTEIVKRSSHWTAALRHRKENCIDYNGMVESKQMNMKFSDFTISKGRIDSCDLQLSEMITRIHKHRLDNI